MTNRPPNDPFTGAVLAVPAAITRGEDAPSDRSETSVAVVDRIVDGRFVVLLLEGEVVDQLVVPHEEFPDVEESDVLLIILTDGELNDAELLEEETERRRKRDEELLERLSGA